MIFLKEPGVPVQAGIGPAEDQGSQVGVQLPQGLPLELDFRALPFLIQNLGPDPIHLPFQVIQLLGAAAGQPGQRLADPGIELGGQHRHQVQTHPVAGEAEQKIPRVHPKVLTQFPAVLRRIGLGRLQEGPVQGQILDPPRPGPGRDFGHALQPVETRSPQEVEQHRLRQIVPGMSHRHRRRASFLGHLGEELVTHLPRALLEGRDVMDSLVLHGVLAVHRKGQVKARRQLADELGVGVGLVPPEVVVQVGHVDAEF